MVTDKEVDTKVCLDKLEEIARAAEYPEYIIRKVIGKVNEEDGPKEVHLRNVNWRVIKAEIENSWDINIKFVNRRLVKSDGWCLFYAVLENENEISTLDIISKTKTLAKIEKIINYVPDTFDIEIENYKINKTWNSDSVDILPFILADCLNISIIVIVFNNEGGYSKSIINKDLFSMSTSKCIALKSNHFWELRPNFSMSSTLRYLKKSTHVRPTSVLPFIDVQTNSEIKNIIKQFNIVGNVCFKFMTLYNLTKTQTKKLIDTNSERAKGVVYMLTCKLCTVTETCYIGETGRELKV